MAAAVGESTNQLEIHVKRIGKGEEVLSFFIDSSANVLDLKKKIASVLQSTNEEVPTERQRLIFSGRMLRVDTEHLTEARMKTDSVNCIHLTPLPEGAQPSARGEDSRESDAQGTTSGQLRGTRDRRRRRMESLRAGFHPYALAIPARIIMSAGSVSGPGGALTALPFSRASGGSASSRATNRRRDATNPPTGASSARASVSASGSTTTRGTSAARTRPATARARSSGSARVRPVATARVRAYAVSQSSTGSAVINLLDGPASASASAGIMSMLERRLAGSVATTAQESAERMRRAALTHLLELTARIPTIQGGAQANDAAAAGGTGVAPSVRRRATASRRQARQAAAAQREAQPNTAEGAAAAPAARRRASASMQQATRAAATQSSDAIAAVVPTARRRATASRQQPTRQHPSRQEPPRQQPLRRSTRRRSGQNGSSTSS